MHVKPSIDGIWQSIKMMAIMPALCLSQAFDPVRRDYYQGAARLKLFRDDKLRIWVAINYQYGKFPGMFPDSFGF